MRLLILVLNILAGSSMVAHSSQSLAASVDSKTNKNNHQRGQATHLHGKNKDHRLFPVKQKKLQNPGDVWERIRSGMQIPRPSPVETLSDKGAANNNSLPESAVTQARLHTPARLTFNSQDASNSAELSLSARHQSSRILALKKLRQPVTASAPLNNYTAYGRFKLNAAISSRIRNNAVLPEQPIASKNVDLDKNTAALVRVHSRIDFHPKLHSLDFKTPTEPIINSTSTPAAKAIKTNHLRQSIDTLYSTRQGLADPTPHHAKEAIKYERVNKHIVWYTQHRDYLHQVTERARPYLYHIVESLSNHKLPYELALLPIVESAYQPTALSPKSAAGLWQFIPSTGQDFDLHQSEQYDARLDITASTQAAMRYMSFLNQHFNGDWLLALAAYNCGLGVVDNAISRNIAEAKDTDYWSLRLPEETQEYVPRFLALSSIFANPDAHGLKLTQVRNEPYFVKVKIDRKHEIDYLAKKDFKEIARLANLSYEQFSRLNPGYLNPELAADGPFTFLMPAGNANELHHHLDGITKNLSQSPTITASHAPLKRRGLFTSDEQKTALSLLTDRTVAKGKDLATGSDPFLSLILNINQTTPRIANEPVISPDDLITNPKQVKKNI